MQDFRNLKIWEKGHQITLDIYKITNQFPDRERFNLVSQMRRAAYSIPTNIAEGCGRPRNTELKRFVEIAMGSASELEYQLLLAKDLNYLQPKIYSNLEKQITEIKKMMASFIVKLRN